MPALFPYSESQSHELMGLALCEALQAATRGDVPVGCIITRGDDIIATGFNRRQSACDPTAHAEIVALREASAQLGTWYLNDCWMFVTLEPCPMCAGALVNARLAGVVYGAADGKAGACHTLYQIPEDRRLNHTLTVIRGIRADECGNLLTNWFKKLRSVRR